MQSSPFVLDTSQNPQLGFEPIQESQLETLDNFVSRMARVTKEAQSALVRAADDMAQFYDAHLHAAPQYNIGDKVWFSSENIKAARPMKKAQAIHINWVISWNAYQLKLPLSFGQVHPVFSVTLLRPYETDSIPKHEKCHLPP